MKQRGIWTSATRCVDKGPPWVDVGDDCASPDESCRVAVSGRMERWTDRQQDLRRISIETGPGSVRHLFVVVCQYAVTRVLVDSCETSDGMVTWEELIRAATTYIRRTCLKPDAGTSCCAGRGAPWVVDICWGVAITGESSSRSGELVDVGRMP